MARTFDTRQQPGALSSFTHPCTSPRQRTPLPPARHSPTHAKTPPAPPLLSTSPTPPRTSSGQLSYQDAVTSEDGPSTNLIQCAAATQDTRKVICSRQLEDVFLGPKGVNQGGGGGYLLDAGRAQGGRGRSGGMLPQAGEEGLGWWRCC